MYPVDVIIICFHLDWSTKYHIRQSGIKGPLSHSYIFIVMDAVYGQERVVFLKRSIDLLKSNTVDRVL